MIISKKAAIVFSLLHLVVGLSAAYAQTGGSNMQRKAEDECEDSAYDAMRACSGGGGGAGMSPQQQQQSQQLQGQANQGNQNVQGAGQNQAAQCKNQMDMSKILGALSALQGGACLAAVMGCKEACGEQSNEETQAGMQQINQQAQSTAAASGESLVPFDTSPAPKIASSQRVEQTSMMKRKARLCEGLAPSAAAAFMQAAGMVAGMLQNKGCQQQSALASPSPNQDCSNPQVAKTNIMCICQADPKNPMCQKGPQFPGGVSTTNDTAPFAPTGSSDNQPSDGNPIMGIDGQAKPASGSATTEGGGGGGMGMGGGRGLQAINDGAGSEGRAGASPSVIQGTANGAGGGGAGGGRGGGGPGGRGRGGGRDGSGFNLADFLPKQAGRNLTGMSIAAKDGITGPLGPSIFEKVTNQYQQQRRNLIQDR